MRKCEYIVKDAKDDKKKNAERGDRGAYMGSKRRLNIVVDQVPLTIVGLRAFGIRTETRAREPERDMSLGQKGQ